MLLRELGFGTGSGARGAEVGLELIEGGVCWICAASFEGRMRVRGIW
jgi:hypothetical protein